MAWRTCEVTQAGPIETGGIFIELKTVDGLPHPFQRWFQAHPSVQKEMLATALCSMSNGMRVDAALPDSLEPADGPIERLYVHK